MSAPWSQLVGDAEALSRRVSQVCGVKAFLDSLTPQQAQQVVEALKRPEVTASGLRKALERRVETRVPAANTFNRHRRGDCRCAQGEK